MIVRQLMDTDAPAVSDLIIANLKQVNSQHYPEHVINRMIPLYSPQKIIAAAKERMVLVAEMLDEIVGTATISQNYFGSVFVRTDMHQRGVGTKLMDSLERLAKQNGMEEVVLHASVNALTFYEKRGYRKDRKVSDAKFGESYEMIKKL